MRLLCLLSPCPSALEWEDSWCAALLQLRHRLALHAIKAFQNAGLAAGTNTKRVTAGTHLSALYRHSHTLADKITRALHVPSAVSVHHITFMRVAWGGRHTYFLVVFFQGAVVKLGQAKKPAQDHVLMQVPKMVENIVEVVLPIGLGPHMVEDTHIIESQSGQPTRDQIESLLPSRTLRGPIRTSEVY